ncbi:MAG TPA: hypothetical protein VMQ83_03695 [Gammaproteobacteria bacterium]|nr:hypothetical protein [Gammaproteobacteria bacterium]
MTADKITHRLEAVGIEADVGGYWLWKYATDFLAAAKSFENLSHRFSPVPYYLVCRSIELSLKAYLYSRGVARKGLKSLSHDLEEALSEAEAKSLSSHIQISPDERNALICANQLYRGKEFEYFESLRAVYDPHEFSLETLAAFAERLLFSVESPVRQAIIK